jgi:hypothetical protein
MLFFLRSLRLRSGGERHGEEGVRGRCTGKVHLESALSSKGGSQGKSRYENTPKGAIATVFSAISSSYAVL